MKSGTRLTAPEVLAFQAERILHEIRTPKEQSAPGNASLIAITGERGAGKTTLLSHVTNTLIDEDQYIVLPTLQPEMWGPSERVVASVVGHLTQLIQDPQFQMGTTDDRNLLFELSQKAFRSAIYMNSGPITDLLARSSSLGQYAADSASVLIRAADVTDDLRALVQKLLDTTKRAGLVIAVDDIDLAPGRLAQLLFEVRMLEKCPGILPIVCLSATDLRGNLRAELAALYPSLDEDSVERAVAQQFMKTIRPDRMFEPLQLPRNERLSYAPFGTEETLGTLLSGVMTELQGSNGEPIGTWLAERVDSYDHRELSVGWLPDTYRGLEHLYFGARALRDALTADQRVLEIGTQIRALIANIAAESHQLDVNFEIQSIGLEGDQARLSAAAQWPRYTAGVTAKGSWRAAFRGSSTKVMFRACGGFHATERQPSASGPSNDGQRPVSTKELSAALMVQSLLSTDIFESPKPGGPLFLTDASSNFLQSIRILGMATDDQFLFLPAASGIVYFDRWIQSWNWVVERIPASNSVKSPIYGVLTDLCTAVHQIWHEGVAPIDVQPAPDLHSALTSVSKLYVRQARLVRQSDNWQTVPALALCQWYERLLPLAFHEALLPEDDLQSALAIWQAAISNTSRADETRSELRIVMLNRLDIEEGSQKVLSRRNVWLYGYRALVRNVAPDLFIYLADYEKEYKERGGVGSKGREAVEESVRLSEHTEVYHFHEHKTEEGIAQEVTIRSALRQLRP